MTTLLTAVLLMVSLGAVLYLGRKAELLDKEELVNRGVIKKPTARGTFGIRGK
jgi:hypothetical protein